MNPTAASILGLLCRKPMSGWELYAGFACSIGQFWSITRSQVYRELRTLGAAGLIEVGATGVRERRVCAITPAGRAAFRTWIAGMPGDEIIRFPLLLTAFFGDSVPPETLRAGCLEHRARHAARLAEYEDEYPSVAESDPYPALALQFGIAYERAVLDWIDGLPWMRGATSKSKPRAQLAPKQAAR